jgi:hypothetical protein
MPQKGRPCLVLGGEEHPSSQAAYAFGGQVNPALGVLFIFLNVETSSFNESFHNLSV